MKYQQKDDMSNADIAVSIVTGKIVGIYNYYIIYISNIGVWYIWDKKQVLNKKYRKGG